MSIWGNVRLFRRFWPIQFGILLTFLAVPIWYRFGEAPWGVTPFYFTRFLILIPLTLTVILWFLLGMPGIRRFLEDKLRVILFIALFAYALWSYASGGWAFMRVDQPDLALNISLQFALVVLFCLVIACSQIPPRWVILVLIVGLIWSVAIGGAQVALQRSLGWQHLGEFPLDPALSGISVIQVDDQRWLRPYALLPHPNPLAGFLGVALLALIAPLTDPRPLIRWSAHAILIIGLWGLLLTFSRGAWLALLGAGVFLLPLLWRLDRLRLTFPLIIATMTAVCFFLIYQPLILTRAGIDQEGQPENTELYSIGERALLSQLAVRTIRDYPLVGVGAGNFPWRASYYFYEDRIRLRGNHVHQVWLSVWAETGLIGFILLNIALIAGFESALGQIRLKSKDAIGRAVLLAGVIALTLIGLFDYYPYTLPQFQILWWGLLAVVISPDPEIASPVPA